VHCVEHFRRNARGSVVIEVDHLLQESPESVGDTIRIRRRVTDARHFSNCREPTRLNSRSIVRSETKKQVQIKASSPAQSSRAALL
jgi:hypothetical protein